jgi:hypothetical protein
MRTIQLKVSETVYEQIKRKTDAKNGATGVRKILKTYLLNDIVEATRKRYEKKV